MATNPSERALLKGANSSMYRGAVASRRVPDTRPHENWRDNLITRVETSDHSCWGNAWKPGVKAEPGQLRLDVHSGRRRAYLLFLKSPVDAYEIAGALQPAFVLVGEGYADPSYPVSGYRQVNVCEERSPEDVMLASLCRGVRDSQYARKLGTLAPEEIRRLAHGKVVLQARAAGMPHVEVKYV